MKVSLLAYVAIKCCVNDSHGFTMNANAGVPKTLQRLHMSSVEAEVDNPRLQGLALALDSGTRKSHSVAQNTAFVTGFFKGLSTKESYGALLMSLYYIYSAMEESFDQTNELGVKLLDDKELRRLEPLKKDLEFFYGEDYLTNKITPSGATKKYVKRIHEVAKDKPYLLVAHQYTRYLGDLFGGQMMGGMATRSLSLDKGKGVSFYTFNDIPKVNVFITDWYKRLNELDLSEVQKQEIVDEANLVFLLNIEILAELEGSASGAFWTLVWNSFREKIGLLK